MQGNFHEREPQWPSLVTALAELVENGANDDVVRELLTHVVQRLCLKAAIAKVLNATWQRCRVHFMRNALAGAKFDVLAYLDFPKAHRTQIATTNPLERLNAEIKRRTDVVGIFPNDPSIVRLVGALLGGAERRWQLQRRYMQLEGLKVVSDNPLHRISAVVNS